MRQALTISLVLFWGMFIVSAGSAAQEVANGYEVTYAGRDYNVSSDSTSFTYTVTRTDGESDLNDLSVEIPVCETPLELIAFEPFQAVSFGTDSVSGVNGIRWRLPPEEDRSYSLILTFAGNILEGEITVALSGGTSFKLFTVLGPACTEPGVSISNMISIDKGNTYQVSDHPPGLDVELGSVIYYRIVVTNTGNATLTHYIVSSDEVDLTVCDLPEELAPRRSLECTLGPYSVEAGQNGMTARVSGNYQDLPISNEQTAYYWGGIRPELAVFKFVTLNEGATWLNTTESPGPQVTSGTNISYRLVIANTGNVPLKVTRIEDSVLNLTDCNFSTELQPGANEECMPDPYLVEAGLHSSTFTVNASYSDRSGIITQSVITYYTGIDAPSSPVLPVVVMITGPVDSIFNNTITLFGATITLNPDDPILGIIRIGDVIQVEGEMTETGEAITVSAQAVTIVDVNVYIGSDGITAWRDDSGCNNPPPPWAAAHGWRERCDPN